MLDRAKLQSIARATAAQLRANREGALAAAGMPSPLALVSLRLLEALAAEVDQDEVSDLLRDLVGAQHRKELRRALSGDLVAVLRALNSDAPLRLACAALIDALKDATASAKPAKAHMEMSADTGGTMSGNSQTLVQGNQIINPLPDDPKKATQEQALRTYLESTMSQCNALSLSSLDPTDAAHRRAMELARVYIGLNTTEQIPLTQQEQAQRERELGRAPDGRDTRPLSALEALSRVPHRRLMLLGSPGTGKSTFSNHLALCLAGAKLSEQRSDLPRPEGGWLARLVGWTLGSLVPIRIVLRDFAAFKGVATTGQGSTRLLIDFLQSTLVANDCEAALEPLKLALHDGKALVLLDGLDEVVGDAVLTRVTDSIAALTDSYPRSPVLVTCRVLDYQAEQLRQIPGFPTQTLADLTDEQIEQFVNDWYAELAASGRRPTAQASAEATILNGAIKAREELRTLARLPLLLTVMALVHTNRGTLPDARSLLYLECIELLLLRWRQPRGEHDLLMRLGLSQFRASDLLVLMARLGFRAHELAARSTDDTPRPADLPESEVMRLLAEGFAQYDPARRYDLAQQVLDALASGNGLLLKRGPGVYAFPHRTFQEFLAGFHLLRQRDYLKECQERAAQPHWHEALTLMVGYQVLAGDGVERPLTLAERLLTQGPTAQTLAGELLNLIGRERAASYDPALVQRDGLWPRAAQTLLHLSSRGRAPEAPAALRVRAGLALGTLCFGSVGALCQPDAPVPLPDPRLPLAMIGLRAQKSPAWKQALEHYWCHVTAGPFWYGDDRHGELKRINLPYDFKIARYPITNADFARFVAAGGYTEQRWWTPEGWKWREQQDITEAWMVDQPRYNNPIQPIVVVTWYEAAAYCIWLTEQGHKSGWLPADAILRLPTSLEWERAARHTDQRRYPWNSADLTPEYANYSETEIGLPSPVGCFPHGAAACGAEEMLGNVREWLSTPYQKDQQITLQKDFTTRSAVLLSRTDYGSKKEQIFCGARYRNYPYNRGNFHGFRIRWSRARIV